MHKQLKKAIKTLGITTSLVSIIGSTLLPSNAQADLPLAYDADRRPDLSLDPFKHAREAMRNLPASKPTLPPPKAPKQTPTDTVTTENAAFSYKLGITMDALSLTSGGIINTSEETPVLKKAGVISLVDVSAKLDTHAAGFWRNGLFFMYSALTFGEGPTIGDLHGVSNINAGGNTMRIVELWYEHRFTYSHSSVLFGLYDFSRDFYASKYAGVFLNYGFRMGQVLRENGRPPTYPVTTLGLKIMSNVTQNSYFQMAIYEGAASKNSTEAQNEFNQLIAINLDKNEGVLLTAEGGIFKNKLGNAGGYYKISAGLWYLRANQKGFAKTNGSTLLENNPKSGTGGIYIFAEKAIGEKLGIFVKHGRGREDYLQYSRFYAAGLNVTGAIPGRRNDVLGFGFVQTRNSSAFLNQLSKPNLQYQAETAIELTYTAQITRWLMVQPDYQYIQYPSMDPNIVKASVIGVRLQATF